MRSIAFILLIAAGFVVTIISVLNIAVFRSARIAAATVAAAAALVAANVAAAMRGRG